MMRLLQRILRRISSESGKSDYDYVFTKIYEGDYQFMWLADGIFFAQPKFYNQRIDYRSN